MLQLHLNQAGEGEGVSYHGNRVRRRNPRFRDISVSQAGFDEGPLLGRYLEHLSLVRSHPALPSTVLR